MQFYPEGTSFVFRSHQNLTIFHKTFHRSYKQGWSLLFPKKEQATITTEISIKKEDLSLNLASNKLIEAASKLK